MLVYPQDHFYHCTPVRLIGGLSGGTLMSRNPQYPFQRFGATRLMFGVSKKSSPSFSPIEMSFVPPIGPREYGGRAMVGDGFAEAAATTTVNASMSAQGTGSQNVFANEGHNGTGIAEGTSEASLLSRIIGVIQANVQIGAQPSAFDIAQAVWAQQSSGFIAQGGFGFTIRDIYLLVQEVHRLQGLDPTKPLTVTPTARTAGDISQTLSGDGVVSTTVTRNV